MDLLDVDGNSATVSKSTPDPGSTKLLLACYRLQDPTSRLQMKVRTTEGEFGDIKATVVAESNPKSAVVVTFPVKPLSLHCRALTLTEEVSKRRVCEMVTDEMATSTTKLTHPIRLAHFARFDRPSLKMRLASLGAGAKSRHERADLVRHVQAKRCPRLAHR